MIDRQRNKAETLQKLHHSDELLILPNIWDVLGAKLLESEGYGAIATASASISFSSGFDDKQEINFNTLLDLLKSICESTNLPVTADIEKGYANSNSELSDNIKKLIHCGIVGINIEDSELKGEKLIVLENQCERIRLIRRTSSEIGIPIVINARTDVFLMKNYEDDRLSEAITRGQHYKDAGADCFYPILCSNDELKDLNLNIELPINVLAQEDTLSIKELEQLGIARLSLGPSLLKSAVTKMREIIVALKNAEGYSSFANAETISTAEIIKIIRTK